MERLTHERVNGIKTGYWSAAAKEVFERICIALIRYRCARKRFEKKL